MATRKQVKKNPVDLSQDIDELVNNEPVEEIINNNPDNSLSNENETKKELNKEYDLFSSSGIVQMLLDKVDEEFIQKEITRHLLLLKEKFKIEDYFILFLL